MSGTFNCSACNRAYPWKPELAGKKARCKCGAVMQVPASLEAAPDEPSLDALESAIPPPPADAPPLPAAAPQCPACSAQLPEGAVLCMACGYNLRTGQRVTTEVGAAPPAGAPRPPGAPRRIERIEPPGAGSLLMAIGVSVLLLLAVVGIFFWRFSGRAGELVKVTSKAADKLSPVEAEDRRLGELLEEEGVVGVRAFMEFEKNGAIPEIGLTADNHGDFSFKWFNEGAANLYFITEGPAKGTLIVEMPERLAWRKKVFSTIAELPRQAGEAAPIDKGQNYVAVKLRPPQLEATTRPQ